MGSIPTFYDVVGESSPTLNNFSLNPPYINPQLDTTTKKYGDGSISFGVASTGWMQWQITGATPNFNFHFWMKSNHVNGLFANRFYGIKVYTSSDAECGFGPLYSNGDCRMAPNGNIPSSTFSDSQWHHYAYSWDSTTNKASIWIDGIQQSDNQGVSLGVPDKIRIIAYNGPNGTSTHIDEIVVENGKRASGNFTPPTSRYTPNANTVMYVPADTTYSEEMLINGVPCYPIYGYTVKYNLAGHISARSDGRVSTFDYGVSADTVRCAASFTTEQDDEAAFRTMLDNNKGIAVDLTGMIGFSYRGPAFRYYDPETVHLHTAVDNGKSSVSNAYRTWNLELSPTSSSLPEAPTGGGCTYGSFSIAGVTVPSPVSSPDVSYTTNSWNTAGVYNYYFSSQIIRKTARLTFTLNDYTATQLQYALTSVFRLADIPYSGVYAETIFGAGTPISGNIRLLSPEIEMIHNSADRWTVSIQVVLV